MVKSPASIEKKLASKPSPSIGNLFLFTLMGLLTLSTKSHAQGTGSTSPGERGSLSPRSDGRPVYRDARIQARSEVLNDRSDRSFRRSDELDQEYNTARTRCNSLTVSASASTRRELQRQVSARIACVQNLIHIARRLEQMEHRFIDTNAASARHRARHLTRETTAAGGAPTEASITAGRENLNFLVEERPRAHQGITRRYQFLLQQLRAEINCIHQSISQGMGMRWVEPDSYHTWRSGDPRPGRCERSS